MAPDLVGVLRDPLQARPTPFEVLGVQPSAGPEDITRAFALKLAAARTAAEKAALAGARAALSTTVRRKLVMAFLYEAQALEQLDPCPLRDTATLSEPRRRATASAWEEQLVLRFPDPAAAHSLAVLWYWTAVSGQGNGFVAAWERAIGFWAMVVAADDFWPGEAPIVPAAQDEVRLRVVERLREDILANAEHRRELPSAVAMQDLMDSELRSALRVARADRRIAGRQVSIGWKLADELRLTGQLSTHGTPVALALSPHEAISELLADGRTATATAEIERLAARAGYDPDLADLHAFARLSEGRSHAAGGDSRAVVDRCESALALANAPALREQVVEELVDACREACRDMEPDIAIGFLEERIAAVPDRRLALQLADLLFIRGVGRMNSKLQSADGLRGDLGGLATSFEADLDDIEHASGLGLERATLETGHARGYVSEVHHAHAIALVNDGLALRDKTASNVLDALPWRGSARCAVCNAPQPEYTLGPKQGRTFVCRSHIAGLQRSLADADANALERCREARVAVGRAIELEPRDAYIATRREIDELIRMLSQPPPPPPPPVRAPAPRPPSAPPFAGGLAAEIHAHLAQAGMTIDDLDPATRYAVERVLLQEGDPYGDLQGTRDRPYDHRGRLERIRDNFRRLRDAL